MSDFQIHRPHRLFGDVALARHGAAHEGIGFAFDVNHDAHLVAHAVTGHHVARQLRGALKVVARPGRHLVHEDFFGNAPPEENGDTREKVLLVVRVAVFFRQLHRHAQRTAARDDRHLMNRIGFRHQFCNERVTGFVVRRILLLVFVHHHGLAFGAHHDLVFGKFEVRHAYDAPVAARGKKCGFVHEVRQIRPGETGSTTGNHVRLNVGCHRHLLHVHVQNLFAPADVGQRHHDLTVKAPRTQQGLIQNVRTVRRRNHDDVRTGFKPVHLHEHLVQGLLTFIVAAHCGTALTAHGINFIDEDDAGRVLLRVFKHVAHTGSAHAHEHFHEVGAGNGEKGNACFAGDRLREKRLTGPRRPHEQHAAGNMPAQPRVFRRILQKVHDFLHVLLGFIAPSDVRKTHFVGGFVKHAGLGFTKGEGTAFAALHLAHEKDPHADQEQHREPAHENLLQERRFVFGLAVDLHPVLAEVIHHPQVPGTRDRIGHTFRRTHGKAPPLHIDAADLASFRVGHKLRIARLIRGEPLHLTITVKLTEDRKEHKGNQHPDRYATQHLFVQS